MMRLTILILAVPPAACNPALRQPAATEPHALLVAQRPASGAISYMAFDNAACRNSDGLGFIGALGDRGAKTKTYRLPTGKPLFLHAASTRIAGSSYTGSGTRFDLGTCSELLRFTPQAAHEYRVTIEQQSCVVMLIDARTNAPPQGLQTQKAPPGCGG